MLDAPAHGCALTVCAPHMLLCPQVPSAQMAYRPPLRQREDLPEEDADVRGGGQLHDEERRWGRGSKEREWSGWKGGR